MTLDSNQLRMLRRMFVLSVLVTLGCDSNPAPSRSGDAPGLSVFEIESWVESGRDCQGSINSIQVDEIAQTGVQLYEAEKRFAFCYSDDCAGEVPASGLQFGEDWTRVTTSAPPIPGLGPCEGSQVRESVEFLDGGKRIRLRTENAEYSFGRNAAGDCDIEVGIEVGLNNCSNFNVLTAVRK